MVNTSVCSKCSKSEREREKYPGHRSPAAFIVLFCHFRSTIPFFVLVLYAAKTRPLLFFTIFLLLRESLCVSLCCCILLTPPMPPTFAVYTHVSLYKSVILPLLSLGSFHFHPLIRFTRSLLRLLSLLHTQLFSSL